VHAFEYVFMFVVDYVCVSWCVCKCVFEYVCVLLCEYIYVSACACVYTRAYVCVFVGVLVSVYTREYLNSTHTMANNVL